MTAHAAVQFSGSFTRPVEPPTPKAVGDRFTFRSGHASVAIHDGKLCEIVECHEGAGYPYTIWFVGTPYREMATDRELESLA